jgi:hypothetical protein
MHPKVPCYWQRDAFCAKARGPSPRPQGIFRVRKRQFARIGPKISGDGFDVRAQAGAFQRGVASDPAAPIREARLSFGCHPARRESLILAMEIAITKPMVLAKDRQLRGKAIPLRRSRGGRAPVCVARPKTRSSSQFRALRMR